MKRSDIPTPYILIRAYTNSEYEWCDFALIKISTVWKQHLQKKVSDILHFKFDSTFFHLVYWGADCDFYMDKSGELPASETIGTDQDWCFVNLSQEEYSNLNPPEPSLDCFQTVIDRYGDICYKCYGKYSETQFQTANFKLDDIPVESL